MVELWFYSGRIGNCMFAYAFNRCIADELKLQCLLPKGTEITGFPNIKADSAKLEHPEQKYIINKEYPQNQKTINNEGDNVEWCLEKQFQGKKITCYEDCITIPKLLSKPNIKNKWILTLGNFETGEQYLPYRNKIKTWFQFPELDINKFEFFKLHPSLGKDNHYIPVHFDNIHKNDIIISLRLEDYTLLQNADRLLTYDYFKIILESKKWNNVYILTNPSSIGHNDQYNWIKEFYLYNPIIVRCYEPVLSMAFGAKFNNIAISQSTYSWWLAFLSNAENIYYPIPKKGPFSFNDENYKGVDLRIASSDFKYVDYENNIILPDNYYTKIDYINKKWID